MYGILKESFILNVVSQPNMKYAMALHFEPNLSNEANISEGETYCSSVVSPESTMSLRVPLQASLFEFDGLGTGDPKSHVRSQSDMVENRT